MNNRAALESFHLRADVIRVMNGPANAQAKTLLRIREIVNDVSFWHHSQQLLDILEPITSAQKQSERDAAHLGLVAPRWDSIRLQWRRMQSSGRYPDVDFDVLHSIFDTRHQQQVQVIHILAPIAIRVLGGIANSVPSERSFSALNHIHSKMRGRLEPEKADKQTFCFMNSRTLERIGSDGRVATALRLEDDNIEPQLVEIEESQSILIALITLHLRLGHGIECSLLNFN